MNAQEKTEIFRILKCDVVVTGTVTMTLPKNMRVQVIKVELNDNLMSGTLATVKFQLGGIIITATIDPQFLQKDWR